MTDVIIADLGTGNLHSVAKAVEHVMTSGKVNVSRDPDQISSAEHLVLPGQGAIGTWVRQMNQDKPLHTAITERLEQGPVLGICLGLQALFESSEENGGTKCLGLLKGRVHKFSSDGQKVPHMGWNQVKQRNDHALWHGISDQERFYFVHSFYATAASTENEMGVCEYGECFTAAAARKNIFATQFHPEKSQHAGLKLIRNFVHWNGVH